MATLPTLDGIRPELMTVVDFAQPVGNYFADELVAATLSLSLTQASTLKLTFIDPRRTMLASPITRSRVTIDTGAYPQRRFTLVQISKSGDGFTATYEDALVARLRLIKGQLAAAAGVLDRVAFARQLCTAAGVTLNAPPPGATPQALEPLTRGTQDQPDEDTWACLVRLAQDVHYRCWSDGTAVWFGPDAYFMGLPVAAQVAEFTDAVDAVDFDYDTGKPVATAKVTTYSSKWAAPIGAHVRLTDQNAAAGDYLVSEISRSLFTRPTAVSLVAPQPALPEPTGSHTVSFTAKN